VPGSTGATGPTGSPFGGGTFTNTITVKGVIETLYLWGNFAGGAFTVDPTTATIHGMVLTGNPQFNGFPTPVIGQSVLIRMQQDATGSRTLSTGTNGNTFFAGGVKTLSTTAGSTDLLSLTYLGPTSTSSGAYLGSLSRGYIP
jgi:hypothetical protein